MSANPPLDETQAYIVVRQHQKTVNMEPMLCHGTSNTVDTAAVNRVLAMSPEMGYRVFELNFTRDGKPKIGSEVTEPIE